VLDQLSTGRPAAAASAPSEGLNERSRCASLPSALKWSGDLPNPISSKIMCGELRCDMLANSSISIASTWRCSDSSANGSSSVMKPGLLPVSKIDVPPRAHASSTRLRCSSPSEWPPAKNAPQVVTTFVPASRNAITSARSMARGM
jgi:hypothetical protein